MNTNEQTVQLRAVRCGQIFTTEGGDVCMKLAYLVGPPRSIVSLETVRAADLGNGEIYELPPEQCVTAGPKAWDLYRDKTKVAPHPEGQPLTCHLEDDRVAIYIGLDELAFAAANHPEFCGGENDDDESPVIKVTDMALFAKEVVRELNKEEEDGSTLVTRLLDDAVRNAVEDGCDGVDHD